MSGPGRSLRDKIGTVSSGDLGQLAATRPRPRHLRELLWPLSIHLVALVVYAGIVIVLFGESNWDPFSDSNSGWSIHAIVVAGWLWFAGGLMWLLRLLNLIRFWLQRRQRLVPTTLVFDSLLWLGPWLGLLLVRKRSRRLIVPPRSGPLRQELR
jgi:hypothetical protein